MTDPQVAIVDRLPTPDEYRALCAAVGWAGAMNLDAAEAALAGSRFGAVALAGERAVAMGRVVGDGALFFYIQDVAVTPEFQGRGVGRQLIARLLERARAAAPGPALVGLFATAAARPLYRRLGFAAHDALLGMFQIIEPDRPAPRRSAPDSAERKSRKG